MDRYPLKAMLKVRYLHEQQAKKDLAEAEAELVQSMEQVRKKEEDLRHYQQWRPIEEERRYASIFGKNMSRKDLDAFYADLALLEREEFAKMEAVEQAKTYVETCRAKRDQLRGAVVACRYACLKLEKHREIWEEQERKEEERKSDLEMEEARGPAVMSEDG